MVATQARLSPRAVFGGCVTSDLGHSCPALGADSREGGIAATMAAQSAAQVAADAPAALGDACGLPPLSPVEEAEAAEDEESEAEEGADVEERRTGRSRPAVSMFPFRGSGSFSFRARLVPPPLPCPPPPSSLL